MLNIEKLEETCTLTLQHLELGSYDEASLLSECIPNCLGVLVGVCLKMEYIIEDIGIDYVKTDVGMIKLYNKNKIDNIDLLGLVVDEYKGIV